MIEGHQFLQWSVYLSSVCLVKFFLGVSCLLLNSVCLCSSRIFLKVRTCLALLVANEMSASCSRGFLCFSHVNVLTLASMNSSVGCTACLGVSHTEHPLAKHVVDRRRFCLQQHLWSRRRQITGQVLR